MTKAIAVTFTVFFEQPFWKGIYERVENNQISVAIVVFGAEPSDAEVFEYLNTHFLSFRFTKSLEIQKPKIIQNYKRLQRNIKKQTQQKGIGTKSQQALQQQREQSKIESKSKSKQLKKQLQQQQFEIKQLKKKEKKKGH